MDIIRCTEEENNTLNEYAASCCDLWDDKEWTVWMQTDDGAFWYTVLDDIGFPSDDNIIEGETGEKMYIDRDGAIEQWSGNIGKISMDNGLSYKTVDELTDDEIHNVLKDIESHDPRFFPEINNLCEWIGPDDDRPWLKTFMSHLCREYVIG